MSKQKSQLIVGEILGHRDGYGFLRPDDGGDDFFVSPNEMLKVMHGDKVAARIFSSTKNGKTEALIKEVLEHSQSELVGRLVLEKGIYLVIPEDKRIKHDILISKSNKLTALPGQIVTVQIVDPPMRDTPPIGKIIEVLGDMDDPGMEVKIAVRRFRIPYIFPKKVLNFEKEIDKKLASDTKENRQDLRDINFFTVDGEDAKDFDDALFVEQIKGKGWRLLVAIADVSHYVKNGDQVDLEAFNRGTSVYFPRNVIPMLPEYLSNNICSLVPDKDRLVLVCDMVISPKGKIAAYQFYEALICSRARFTYELFWDLINGKKTINECKDDNFFSTIISTYKLFKQLSKNRRERGAINFETTETQIELNDQGRINKISRRIRNDSHRVIEECMLAANFCAADFISKNGKNSLYRVHQNPSEEKLNDLRLFLRTQGLNLEGGDNPTSKNFSNLLDNIKKRSDSDVLQALVLRTMQQAQYASEEKGHFALALNKYTHFTSPIRRYPDLLVHRVIKSILFKKNYLPKNELFNEPEKKKDMEIWNIVAEKCSIAERRAEEATRDVISWLKCHFMQDRVGEQMRGLITGVTSFGVFVTLDDLYVEGLVHVSELGSEYFQYNNVTHEIRGERTGKRFKLYDSVIVKLLRVDVDARKIDFALATPMVLRTKTNSGFISSEKNK